MWKTVESRQGDGEMSVKRRDYGQVLCTFNSQWLLHWTYDVMNHWPWRCKVHTNAFSVSVLYPLPMNRVSISKQWSLTCNTIGIVDLERFWIFCLWTLVICLVYTFCPRMGSKLILLGSQSSLVGSDIDCLLSSQLCAMYIMTCLHDSQEEMTLTGYMTNSIIGLLSL